MKAAVTTAYGPPDVVQVQEIDKPTPKDDAILVKVHAAVVGPADCAFRKGEPFIIKLMYGFSKPRLKVGGVEFAGEVEAVGSAVTTFQPGDQVFDISPDSFGAHAEYLTVPANKPVVLKPANLTFEEAVAIMDGPPTALTFLRDVAHLQRGQKLLINGASGAVGGYAVQLARHFGAEITGVCSTANVARVKALGADHVIDYTQTDFTQTGETWDVIFDAVGKRTFGQCKRALTPNGVYMTTVPSFAIVGAILTTRFSGGKKAKFTTAGLKQNKDNLNFLKDLAESGDLQPVIDRRYPLDEIVEAYRYVETERKTGNVVITL